MTKLKAKALISSPFVTVKGRVYDVVPYGDYYAFVGEDGRKYYFLKEYFKILQNEEEK